MLSPEAVSYTHLDVYKRQPLTSIVNYVDLLKRENLQGAVSYTHLDVYKRQGIYK